LKSLDGHGPPQGSIVVEVPRGIVVIKQEQPTGSAKNARLGYYVLEDDSELSGSDIKDPKQASDPQTSEPIVTFSFTDAGRKAFARATKREAQRGQNLLAPGVPNQAKFQRVAISLDNQIRSLATVRYIAYAVLLFAMVKLIPITMTLPGIAGLILTLGVAADANIVIFERIKEEARQGRSIPAAIASGYQKGIRTIVDANVVTIGVAFILFTLATAGVKGFAFTLGIGTLVSLFTAVLATSAIRRASPRSVACSRRSGTATRRSRVSRSRTLERTSSRSGSTSSSRPRSPGSRARSTRSSASTTSPASRSGRRSASRSPRRRC